MNDREILLEATHKLVECLQPWIPQVENFEWNGTQGFLLICRRGAIVRQFESLKVIIQLIESNHGETAVPLLRAACEELIWLRYLNTLSTTDAECLVECRIKIGILKDLEAQVAEAGEEETQAMGLAPALRTFRVKEPEIRDVLKDLGQRLGWRQDVTRRGEIPSTWFIAQSTNSENIYRFLFHATSRYVHFSPVELARRGWGAKGVFNVSSKNYEPIWAAFALSWGTRILGWTLQDSFDTLTAEGVKSPDMGLLQGAFDAITSVPLIPLVTPDELRWDS